MCGQIPEDINHFEGIELEFDPNFIDQADIANDPEDYFEIDLDGELDLILSQDNPSPDDIYEVIRAYSHPEEEDDATWDFDLYQQILEVLQGRNQSS